MKEFLKKLTTARNIPMLALALFAAVFLVSEINASGLGAQSEEWIYDNDCGDPTNPACYDPHAGDLENDCVDLQNEVCGIKAPLDATHSTPRPLIEGQLEADLNSGNFLGKQDIYAMPRSN